MAKNRTDNSKDQNLEAPPEKVSDQALAILMKEYDALRDFYNQTEQRAQSLFNYYLTLMTAVFGGLIIISQIIPSPAFNLFVQRLLMGALLIFFATIGSLHLSSLSTYSAHAKRYSRGMNEIRKLMIEKYNMPLTPIYKKFVTDNSYDNFKNSKIYLVLSMIIPVSIYQYFVTAVNSLSWAFVLSFIFLSVHAPSNQIIWRGVTGFIVTYLIYSIYARLVYEITISRLNVRIGN